MDGGGKRYKKKGSTDGYRIEKEERKERRMTRRERRGEKKRLS